MKIIILLIGFIALIFVGISQYDKIKKENFEKLFKDDSQKNVMFLERLASYKYLDMWVAIKQVMGNIK